MGSLRKNFHNDEGNYQARNNKQAKIDQRSEFVLRRVEVTERITVTAKGVRVNVLALQSQPLVFV